MACFNLSSIAATSISSSSVLACDLDTLTLAPHNAGPDELLVDNKVVSKCGGVWEAGGWLALRACLSADHDSGIGIKSTALIQLNAFFVP